MAVDAPGDPEAVAESGRGAPLTRPRPGHADLVGMQKYGFDDARNVLERASARETAMRVGLAAVARCLLDALDIDVVSHVVRIGAAAVDDAHDLPVPADQDRIDDDPVRCADPDASKQMQAAIDEAKAERDTLGGVVEVLVYGVPPGLGSHVHWDRKLDTRLAAALMSVQAFKAVEIGDGLRLGSIPGSQAHDEIAPVDDAGTAADADGPVRPVTRLTDRAGGVEGGMSTGAVLRMRTSCSTRTCSVSPGRRRVRRSARCSPRCSSRAAAACASCRSRATCPRPSTSACSRSTASSPCCSPGSR
jgi:chorismate synthase